MKEKLFENVSGNTFRMTDGHIDEWVNVSQISYEEKQEALNVLREIYHLYDTMGAIFGDGFDVINYNPKELSIALNTGRLKTKIT